MHPLWLKAAIGVVIVLALGLASCGAVMAQTAPPLGAYTSADGQVTLQITAASPQGQLQGNYRAINASTPDQFYVAGDIGMYACVFNTPSGATCAAPFLMRFSAYFRPASMAYAIVDSWSGAYLGNGYIVATGSRSHVDNYGKTTIENLGEQVFTLKR